MVLGLLLIAMISGATVSVALLFLSSPVWIALIAYPVTGTLVMLFGLGAISAIQRIRPQPLPLSGSLPRAAEHHADGFHQHLDVRRE